jgi:ATP-dependent DNA ligase
MKSNGILEAALSERQEYLEELVKSYNLIKQQIIILEQDIDELLFKLMEQPK